MWRREREAGEATSRGREDNSARHTAENGALPKRTVHRETRTLTAGGMVAKGGWCRKLEARSSARRRETTTTSGGGAVHNNAGYVVVFQIISNPLIPPHLLHAASAVPLSLHPLHAPSSPSCLLRYTLQGSVEFQQTGLPRTSNLVKHRSVGDQLE